MASYPGLQQRAALVDRDNPAAGFARSVTPYLIDVWLDDYESYADGRDVLETQASGFNYLFDPAAQRLIAAWGVSAGRHGEKRDASRMAGHPLSAGPFYHRGHAIPHTLGGPTDINLVPQLGRINIGAFRPLEKLAVATPGSLYFTYWTYLGAAEARGGYPGQTPTGVDQGLIVIGQAPQIRTHLN
jgi:hypothetical protein